MPNREKWKEILSKDKRFVSATLRAMSTFNIFQDIFEREIPDTWMMIFEKHPSFAGMILGIYEHPSLSSTKDITRFIEAIESLRDSLRYS